MQLGEKMRIVRQSKAMTQTQLAEISGVSHITISAIELGRVKQPWLSTMDHLAEALGVTLDFLVQDVTWPERNQSKD